MYGDIAQWQSRRIINSWSKVQVLLSLHLKIYFFTSKSKKVPIYKDHGIARHNEFRRKIKRRIRQKVRDIINLIDKDSYELPHPKVLVNDWDWCDYILDYRFKSQSRYIKDSEEYEEYFKESQVKYSRK